MITIAGGTGRVGRNVTSALTEARAQVRVLTRDPDAAHDKLGTTAGVELVAVDFDDPRTLVAAFAGAGSAFLSLGTSARQVRDEIALIDAAVAAGVGFLVNLSVGGAQREIANDVLDWHSEIDAHLEAQEVDWTLVRPATYADAVVDIAANLLPAGGWGGHAGRGRASLIDTRDVAAVAATALLEGPADHAGRAYDITGPEPVTMHDVADLLARALTRTVRYADRTRDQQRAVLESLGLPALRVEVLLGLDDLFRGGVYAQPTSTVEDVTGHAPRPVDEYVGEHLAAFAAA
ncbi:MAG: hypothetical protein V7607_4439 [Solirubrobacteraceae bacterium]